jgi:hypothetical protein
MTAAVVSRQRSCDHCGDLFEARGLKRFCGQACRKASGKQDERKAKSVRHLLEEMGENERAETTVKKSNWIAGRRLTGRPRKCNCHDELAHHRHSARDFCVVDLDGDPVCLSCGGYLAPPTRPDSSRERTRREIEEAMKPSLLRTSTERLVA